MSNAGQAGLQGPAHTPSDAQLCWCHCKPVVLVWAMLALVVVERFVELVLLL